MEPLHRAVDPSRGFTLIELLVVAAIILVVTGVIFAGQKNFSSTVLLTNTVYDIALTAHDAQTYGLGTRAQGGSTNAGYGLDFQKNSPGSYVLFADTSPAPSATGCHGLPVVNGVSAADAPNAYPGDCVYTATSDSTILTYSLGNGMTIANFCAYNGTNWQCSATCGATTGCTLGLSKLDIIYLRPNATPFMSVNGAYSASAQVTQSCIQTVSPQNTSAYIYFYNTGQIVGNAASCP